MDLPRTIYLLALLLTDWLGSQHTDLCISGLASLNVKTSDCIESIILGYKPASLAFFRDNQELAASGIADIHILEPANIRTTNRILLKAIRDVVGRIFEQLCAQT
jgi:hypothetical protein